MVPYRGEGDEVRHLMPSGDVGKVNPMPFHPRDEESIRNCIGNSDIVLNFVGKYYETKNLYLKKNYTYSLLPVHHPQIPGLEYLLPRALSPHLQRDGCEELPARVGSPAELEAPL